jgi:hypothetical protein
MSLIPRKNPLAIDYKDWVAPLKRTVGEREREHGRCLFLLSTKQESQPRAPHFLDISSYKQWTKNVTETKIEVDNFPAQRRL